jgi:hypothetical protein
MTMRRSGFIPKLQQPSKSRSPGPPTKSVVKGKVRGTRSAPDQDFFEGCFEDFQKMQVSGPPPGKTQVEVFTETFCNNCRNTDCARAGNKTLTWVKRMRDQPEWLLNNPIFSELATLDHQRIHELQFPQRKQEQEKLLLDWNPGSKQDQALQDSWESPPPAEQAEQAEQAEPSSTPVITAPSISAKGPAPSPSAFQGDLPKLPNISTPQGGIVLSQPAGSAPSPTTSIHDVWSTTGPKVVQPGAVIRLGPSRK